MTEIPLPPGDYEAPAAPKKQRGCGTTLIVVLVIAIVVVAGVVIVLMSGLSNGPTSGSHDEREIADYQHQDIELTPTYYRGGFSVSSSEVQTTIVPDLLFDIYVRDTGNDSVSASAHIAVYEASVSVVDSASTWGDLDTYLVGEGTYPSPFSQRVDLYNDVSSYTWVLWFEASNKTDVWDVDITLTLRYNWVP